MQKLQENHIFAGMQRDTSISKHPAQFLYDGRNIRLTAREGNTLMSITNEKGTSVCKDSNSQNIAVSGQYLGHCLLNHYLVVFSVDSNNSYITRVDLSASPIKKVVLFSGDLGFSTKYPIEAIGSYETEKIQKVYWTDGYNQPRIINIVAEELMSVEWDDNKSYMENLQYSSAYFDFIPVLQLQETVTVSRLLGASGEFASGVIQYAFTYYRKYGQETNFFYTSPLRFIAHKDRGGSPEEKISTAFEIKINDVDTNFDFIRIYSIQRTSLNDTPLCKRVVDIEIGSLEANSATYIDTGVTGNTVDPTELLYKGGEEIKAKTLEQKDGTLFLGNLSVKRPSLLEDLKNAGYYDSGSHKINADVGIDSTYNNVSAIVATAFNASSYKYFNQLTGKNSSGEVGVPCAGFKGGDTYRCGVQFQYKTGAWSSPFFIKDLTIDNKDDPELNINPVLSDNILSYPRLEGNLSAELTTFLKSKGYVKARAVIVYPEFQDRTTICQGVVCPTMYTTNHRSTDRDLLAQSSWFFRPKKGTDDYVNNNETASPWSHIGTAIPYTKRRDSYNPNSDPGNTHPYPDNLSASIRQVEVQGFFNDDDRFRVEWNLLTFHSPDIEFDSQIPNTEFLNMACYHVGNADFRFTMSDIDIQTESPTASNSGSGFIHKTFNHKNSWGIIAGLFYDDYAVDDNGTDSANNPIFERWENEKSSFKWMVYPWQRKGSLNNDISRPTNAGTQTAILKKKVISNLRYAYTNWLADIAHRDFDYSPELFSSNEATIIKVGFPDSNFPNTYQGNVDTVLNSELQGKFFAFGEDEITATYGETEFNSTNWWKLFGEYDKNNNIKKKGIYHFQNSSWGNPVAGNFGDKYEDLVITKDLIRMKYKSTPHLVFYTQINFGASNKYYLPIVDIRRNSVHNAFGGDSMDALKANIWLPCGKAVLLGNKEGGTTKFNYNYGDTYFQRWDCLKTYPFTPEDENQIVEIGSFELQTHINIDGRYDRNRGQSSNLNMSPVNFNLINPVYSQRDNFFTYRILDDDYYRNDSFPNQITWSKEKQAGADVDLWTNITLASTYDMDGSKGEIEELVTYKDLIFCFQPKGISNILFNSRVQIPTSDNTPIEISNSYKVDGYRYLSDGIGCDNTLLVRKTPAGIYFIDSISSHLFHIADGLTDLSEKCGMTTWFRDNAGSINRLLYDDINHDVYAVQDYQSLCFSEKLNQFTGLYDYSNIKLIETCNQHVFTLKDSTLWRMFESQNYCNFFSSQKPWSFTFISNGINDGLVNTDKTFTNLEFRACVEGEGTYDESKDRFTPLLPVDYLETWNEYQHGYASLGIRNGHSDMIHHQENGNASLKRKFRIWRCDIPRNNCQLGSPAEGETWPYSTDAEIGISRKVRKPVDRMRNPWLYLKLQKSSGTDKKTELHDIQVTYYI